MLHLRFSLTNIAYQSQLKRSINTMSSPDESSRAQEEVQPKHKTRLRKLIEAGLLDDLSNTNIDRLNAGDNPIAQRNATRDALKKRDIENWLAAVRKNKSGSDSSTQSDEGDFPS